MKGGVAGGIRLPDEVRHVFGERAETPLAFHELGGAGGDAPLQFLIEIAQLFLRIPALGHLGKQGAVSRALSQVLRCKSAKTATLERRTVALIGLCR